MRRTTLLAVPLVALAVTGSYLAGTVHAPAVAAAAEAADPAQQGIVVAGLGKVSGTPDVLRLQVGVEVRRADVSAALSAANTLQNRVRDALRRGGVDPKDMQTSDVSIYPNFDDKGRPNGYTVSQRLTVKLRDLARAGRTIGEAVDAGGSAARVHGVSFDLEDNAALLQRARDAAFADARQKAQRYADLSGRALGPVELVSEQLPGEHPVPYATPATDAAKSSAVPIEPGRSEVSVAVTVRWSLR
jgi:uncharacterized protein YggE